MCFYLFCYMLDYIIYGFLERKDLKYLGIRYDLLSKERKIN